MARIIYAWELGGDYGHINSFMPLALVLRDQGHEVIFIVRDLTNAEKAIAKHRFQILQAPVWNANVKGLPSPPLNYTEIIMRYGFFNKNSLSALNRAWLGLFRLIKPDLIIGDHSPVTLFTARAIGVPRAVYGTGFCSPPHISPMPNMRPWVKLPEKRLQNSDEHAIKIMNSLLTDMQSKAPPITSVADLFKVDIDFLCTFPEMDHYQNRQKVQYWGATFNAAYGKNMAWQVDEAGKLKDTKRIFAYLKPQYKPFEKVLQALKDSGANVLVFSPDITAKQIETYQTQNMQFASDPIQLNSILPDCDLALCHAGHGTIAACLLAGVPLMLLPMQLEQFLGSSRVKQLGAGEIVNMEKKEETDFGKMIADLLSKPDYKVKAKAFAQKYSKFNQADQFNLMAKKIAEVLQAYAERRKKAASERATALNAE